ncbi:MAG: crossover junction endodeoxyribonuclease RuvC [Gammaproteobacteria bacterium]|nr:crossover junction endodeoxyribonuclease RuvC [Gammaproteobacteria bacterium]MDP2139314.1 crossover junction endodeoxyribonuclease RuvC [Gammaproteobacteria bacterium]MDP2346871.1 crossover junction endodeoxyribonuclease RuvC [Gammaproteobacteria bacterium]
MAMILGIDPGSRLTGYGIVNSVGNRLEYVTCGSIRLPDVDHPQRLKQIFDSLCSIIEQFVPQECAIEEVFLGKSVSSALKLGQARGAAMVACLHHDLPVAEYSPRKVKQALVGNGSADKVQVQHMVKVLLGVSGEVQEDAADALAIAICHANTKASLLKVAGARSFRNSRLQL